nr:hypothetical protein [Fructobacillus broussonetiae]
MVTGEKEVDGEVYFFLKNGVELRNHSWVDHQGQLRYSGLQGVSKIVSRTISGKDGDGTFFSKEDGNQYFILKATNELAKGLYVIDKNIQFFDMETGAQAKGVWKSFNGNRYYFASGSGNGVKGVVEIDKIFYLFGDDGKFVGLISDVDHPTVHPSKDGLEKIPFLPESSQYKAYGDGSRFKFENNGSSNTGLFRDKDGHIRYFDDVSGYQTKGQIQKIDGNYYCFDKNSGVGRLIKNVSGGHFVINQEKTNHESVSYVDAQGVTVKGLVQIDGQVYYFDLENGIQRKGVSVRISGQEYYFDGENGSLDDVRSQQTHNGWVLDEKAQRFYFDSKSNSYWTGKHSVDGHEFFFREDGHLALGEYVAESNGTWSYYARETGYKAYGATKIDGSYRFFDKQGIQVKGDWAQDDQGRWSYYDADQGKRLIGNQTIKGKDYKFDKDGILIAGDAPLPDNPVNPDQPVNPDKPVNPDQPVNPDKPVNPDQPVKPDKPVNPDQPDKPAHPSANNDTAPHNVSYPLDGARDANNSELNVDDKIISSNDASNTIPEKVDAQSKKSSELSKKATNQPKLSRVKRSQEKQNDEASNGFFHKVGHSISDAGKSIGQVLANTGKVAGGFFVDAGRTIGDVAHTVADAVSEATDTVVQTTQHIWHKVTGFFKDWFM